MIQLALIKASDDLPDEARLRSASFVEGDAGAAVVAAGASSIQDGCDAASQGKHVFVKLPGDATSASVERLIESCQDTGVRLMVGGSTRFDASVQTVRQSLDAGQLGDPGLLRIHRWNSTATGDDSTWQDIDLAIWMFGELPATVYAVARSIAAANGSDFLQIHLGFSAGGMALIDLSNNLPAQDGDPQSYYSLSLIGSSGAAYADDHHNQQLLFASHGAQALKTGAGDLATTAELQEFVDAIAAERDPGVSGRDALAALQVREAALASAECGKVARLTTERRYEC